MITVVFAFVLTKTANSQSSTYTKPSLKYETIEDNFLKDIFFLISSDANHYGEDFNNIHFGLDESAHKQAAQMETDIAREYFSQKLITLKLKFLRMGYEGPPKHIRRYGAENIQFLLVYLLLKKLLTKLREKNYQVKCLSIPIHEQKEEYLSNIQSLVLQLLFPLNIEWVIYQRVFILNNITTNNYSLNDRHGRVCR